MKKNIIVGICGSIAIYKSCEVVRKLIKNKWNVKVIMTKNAQKFVSPLTFEVLSKNPVYIDMFEKNVYEEDHIALSDFADLILVCPATANIIGKIACGICDDLLTTTIISFPGTVIFAPAMNENMWKNKIVVGNVEKLKKYGYLFIGPGKGELASGKRGIGRLVDPEKIINFVEKIHKKF
ncbi:MAG: hypothetical protein NC915_04170 [Candidatus Omnitrophica bacterium]|nr:hypothetical protein [Candidatus Omnitrophota bacterium]